MAAAYRTSAVGGSSSGTANRTVTITPAIGDLLIIYCIVAANTNDTPTCSDNNGSGTYDLINVMNATIGGIEYRMSVFIRTALMANTTSTTITVATGSNTSGAVHAIAVSGMSRTGSNAVRSKGSQNNQAAGTAAPILNQNALTGNMTIVAHGSADTTTTAPTNWTERQDTNFSNDTVALETATRDSGFTGNTITFGAASSTVFCSHALELDNSALFTRSAAIDGAGAIASAATFFTVFSRSSLVDVAGLIATVGRRDSLRSCAVGADGAVLTSGVFFSVFSGSALVDGAGTVVSSGSVSAVVTRSAAIGGTAVLTSSGIFFSVFNGTVAVEVTASIETSANFYSIVERNSGLDVAGSVESSGIFFSAFLGVGLIDGTGAIASNGEIQAGAGEHERSAAIGVSGDIASDGFAILERAASLDAAGVVATSGLFFSVFQSVASFTSDGLILTTGQRDLVRSASVEAAGDLSGSGIFFSLLESSSTLSVTVTIDSSGVIGAEVFERSILIHATSSIISSGTGIHVVTFRPREVLGIGAETQRVVVSREDRVRLIESEQQTNVL